MRIVLVTSIICSAVALPTIGQAADPQSPPQTSPASAPATSPTTTPAASAPSGKPQRVVLRVNRNVEVKGVVQLEDDDVIVVRDLHGENQSFAKARINQIVRLTEPQPDQTGLVIMLDGQVREGKIIEDAYDYVIVEIEGIRANIKRAAVSHVILEPTIDERYAEYKRTMDPNNHDAHLTLCRWLYEQRRYEQAKDELLALLEKVELADARRLLTLVDAHLKLKDATSSTSSPTRSGSQPAADSPDKPPKSHEFRPDQPPPQDDNHDAGPVRPADIMPSQLLTDEDVNIIRVYEIDFDHPPRVTITPDTVRELIEKYGTDPLIPANQVGRNAMFRAAADNPLQIVRLMFELRARDMYSKVQVNSEPYALNLFRRRVHDTWLINNCATSACHGSPYAGQFFLHRRDYKDDRVRYTNMLILDRLKIDPDWPLINYDRPDDSLIVQYALPRELARKPHPRVDGWKPAFNPTNARLKEDTVEWIKAMMEPRPDYPVDYQPPALGKGFMAAPPIAPDGNDDRVPR